MKTTLRVLAATAAATIGAVALPGLAAATGDEYSCPAGTTFDYKIEPLDGHTFTVPTPPAGWTVTGVVLKVGGPGGGTHITFAPVSPGQVLDVSYQQHEISHAHVCKSNTPTTTTTTTTTPDEPTTTTTTPPTTTTPDNPTTTTPDEPTTTTPEQPTTTVPTVAVDEPPVPTTPAPVEPTDPTTTISTATGALPATGAAETTRNAVIAAALIGLGALALRLTRRPVR